MDGVGTLFTEDSQVKNMVGTAQKNQSFEKLVGVGVTPTHASISASPAAIPAAILDLEAMICSDSLACCFSGTSDRNLNL